MSELRSHRWSYALAVLILGGLLFLGDQAQTASSATPSASSSGSSSGSSSAAAVQQAQSGDSAAIYRGVLPVVKFDVSPPLSSMRAPEPPPGLPREMRETENSAAGKAGPQQDKDSIVQSIMGPLAIPTPIISFDSNLNLCACSPPDPTGEIGPNHYVSMSNLHTQIFNRSGVSVLGPVPNNTFWAGFGGLCQIENAGDPIVLYDQLADRWLLSQFTANGPLYYNCVAISTTGDPTGTYYRYAFSTGSNFPDYPKYGVWPDAYFISTREFTGPAPVFAGVGAYAANRAQMLSGDPNPQVISFLVPPGNEPWKVGDGLLPSDLDGTTLPPAGSPNYFVGSMDNGGPYGAPQDALTLWKFVADFKNPSNSSFTHTNTIPIQGFDTVPAFCSGRNCVPQPGTTNRLDHLGYRQRPTMRLAYRNFGTHESLVTNQSVEASTTMSGIRWWEIRSPNNNPVIHQEGTYAPGVTDGIHRWMGSIAQDRMGNMGLGYSASSATLFPSVRYSGRLATDPPGQMPQGEASIHEGTGSQTSSQRWGDYTHMAIDPVDDCTFWYINEYVPTSSGNGWRMRVGAFKFENCVQGTPTPAVTGTPPAATNTAIVTPSATRTGTPIVPTLTSSVTQTQVATGTRTGTTTATVGATMSATMMATSTSTRTAVPCNGRITICHRTGNGHTHTISISCAVLNAHIRHGDTVGACVRPTRTPGTHSFRDVNSSDYFYEHVYDLRDAQALGGYADGTFRPYNQATRAQLVKIVVLAFHIPLYSGSAQQFSDVPRDHPFYQYIMTAWERNIITGYADGTFRPYNNVTRGQISKISVESARIDLITPSTPSFSDVPANHTFYRHIETAYAHGILSGYADGTFKPEADATRGQIAKIVNLATHPDTER